MTIIIIHLVTPEEEAPPGSESQQAAVTEIKDIVNEVAE